MKSHLKSHRDVATDRWNDCDMVYTQKTHGSHLVATGQLLEALFEPLICRDIKAEKTRG